MRRPRTSNRRARRKAAASWACLSIVVAACGAGPARLVGYEVLPTPEVGGFTLADAAGDDTPFVLRAPPGDVLVVYLGFTHCPDACPTALAEIRAAMSELGPRAERVDVAMITVDPARDAGRDFAAYVHQFVADGHALRTDDPIRLREIVSAFGASSAARTDDADMEVAHTDYTYAVDDAGRVVVTWTAEMSTDDIVNDLEILLERAQQELR